MHVLLITGDRAWNDFGVMFKAIKNVAKKHNGDVLVVNGDCVGADKMSTNVSNILKLNLALFPCCQLCYCEKHSTRLGCK